MEILFASLRLLPHVRILRHLDQGVGRVLAHLGVRRVRQRDQQREHALGDERRVVVDRRRLIRDRQDGVALDLELDVLGPRQRAQGLQHARVHEGHAVPLLRAQVADAERADALARRVLAQQVGDQELVAAALDDEVRRLRVRRAQVRQEAPGLALHLDVARPHHRDRRPHAALARDDLLVLLHLRQVREAGAGLGGDDHVVALAVRDERRHRAAFRDLELVLVAERQVVERRADFSQNLHVLGREEARQGLEAALLDDLHLRAAAP